MNEQQVKVETRGRKAIDEAMRRNCKAETYMTKTDLEILKAKAERAERKLSVYIHDVLFSQDDTIMSYSDQAQILKLISKTADSANRLLSQAREERDKAARNSAIEAASVIIEAVVEFRKMLRSH